MQQNMAAVIRTIMEKRNQSLDKFSEELEISRSMLQEYLKGKGNPCIKTIIHLSKKLGIEPAFLLTGMRNQELHDLVLPLLDTVQKVSELKGEKKVRFTELFLEMVQLWSDET